MRNTSFQRKRLKCNSVHPEINTKFHPQVETDNIYHLPRNIKHMENCYSGSRRIGIIMLIEIFKALRDTTFFFTGGLGPPNSPPDFSRNPSFSLDLFPFESSPASIVFLSLLVGGYCSEFASHSSPQPTESCRSSRSGIDLPRSHPPRSSA